MSWKLTALAILLSALSGVALEALKVILFPHLSSSIWRVVTGTWICVLGSAIVLVVIRRHSKLLVMHKQSENRLALERNLLRTVTDNIPDSIFAKDCEGRYVLVNRAFAQLHGAQTTQELLGKTAFDMFPMERATLLHTADLEVMRGAGLPAESERSVKDEKGNVKWILMTKVPLINESGKVIGIVGMNRDISRRKKAELDLQRAKQEAEDASNAKSTFLATMSHEIRTPMNGILGMTELVLDTDLSREQRDNLGLVKLSAESLLTVINDILDFSKIEAGKLDIELIPFDLRESLGETMKALGYRAHQKDLELIYEVQHEIPEAVVGDPGRIRQVIVNLVGNAIKFTEKGEILLSVTQEAASLEAVKLCFAVKDTGIGIPDNKQRSVFEAFSQADGSTTRKYGGTGLGLAICTKLIDLMGGRIALHSIHGEGSTFSFTIRLAIQATGSTRPPPLNAGELRDLSVLIVDDNLTNRRVLMGMLSRWGMKPTAVESGAEAIHAIATATNAGTPFRIIMLDGHMPEMDGFTLAGLLQKDLRSTQMALMMLTSAGHTGDAARCRELGIKAYLVKPVRQMELLDSILNVLKAAPEQKPLALVTRHSLKESRQRAQILLAEDNAINQMLAVRILEKRGYSVTVVGDGYLALAALATEPFDLILMDIQMPGMDGFEATAAIREKEKSTGKHLPIIAMTAHALKGDQERCLAAGMDGYVSKPIRTSELFSAIELLIKQSTEKLTENQFVVAVPDAQGSLVK